MSESLLQPPNDASPQISLALSQQAPSYIKSQTSWSLPYPLNLFFNPESQEKWQIYENMFHACLQTGDNDSAYLILTEFTKRFGNASDRVRALQGLYLEANAKDRTELEGVMREYEEILKEDPTILPVRKRRAALLRSLDKTAEAIAALTNLLDTSPTDAEAWSELADIYLTQGLYDQAIFCLEEVLLISPNAWNMHARLGEVLYLAASRPEAGADQVKNLSESMRRFCRSIELCDNYLRGYYGLKLTTSHLIEALSSSKRSSAVSWDASAGELAPPTVEAVTKLNEIATAKLAEIVRRSASGEKGWDGYSQSELIAARELIDRDTQRIQR